jgi:hypothetical protein
MRQAHSAFAAVMDDQRASAPAPVSLLLLGERSHPGVDASRQTRRFAIRVPPRPRVIARGTNDRAGHAQRRESVGHSDPRDGTACSSNSLGPVHRAPLVELQVGKPTLYPYHALALSDTLCPATNGGVLFPPCSHLGGAEFGIVPWIRLCRASSIARPSGFEPETFGSVDRRSIQLSYGRPTD